MAGELGSATGLSVRATKRFAEGDSASEPEKPSPSHPPPRCFPP